MRVLSNPVVFRLLMALFASGFGFWLAILALRRMRRIMTEDSFMVDDPPELEQLPMHAYNAVIQQLKQQKHELMSVQQVERRRAKTSENISAAVLSNLSSGVLFLSTNGLVRSANSAAKSILGFASPVGMSVGEIFREAMISSVEPPKKLAAAVIDSLREHSASHIVEVSYTSPAGGRRILEITISPVWTALSETLGVACLITDKTEFAVIQKRQQLRGEMSAEMALALRSSVATISSYAQQLAVSKDAATVRQLAVDIASEAAELDHTIGGFLAGERATKSAATGA